MIFAEREEKVISSKKKRKRMKKLVSKVHINEDGEMGEDVAIATCVMGFLNTTEMGFVLASTKINNSQFCLSVLQSNLDYPHLDYPACLDYPDPLPLIISGWAVGLFFFLGCS